MMLLGKDLKDVHEEDLYSGPDPLGNARKDLDFAAFAAGAPSVKSILFKAQTMGPLPRSKPGGKAVGGAAAAVLVLALLLAPWLPMRSSILALQMGFEKDLSRREASELYSELLKNEPRGTILSASFSPVGATDLQAPEGGSGHLRINATAFDTSRSKLEERLRQLVIVHGRGGLEPMFSQSALVETTRRVSPVGMLVSRLRPQGEAYVGQQPDNSPAQIAARHADQIAYGLSGALSTTARDIQVLDSRFVSPVEAQQALEDEEFSFTVPAWPSDLAIKMQPYKELTESEQAGLRDGTRAYLTSLGIGRGQGTPTEALVPAAGAWLPVSVSVRDRNGNYDAYLTSRLQALIKQPSIKDLRDGKVNPDSIISQAIEQLLPRCQYRPVYGDEFDWVNGQRIHVYNIQIYLQAAASEEVGTKGSGMFDEARDRLDKAASTEW